MNLRIRTIGMIESSDWDDFVQETYGRPYCFQQQDGCQSRGTRSITVPEESEDEYMHDSIEERVNGSKMGVKFQVWLDRDPKAVLKDNSGKVEDRKSLIGLFWERNFYPDLQTVANDLHAKGLLDAGEYIINIDW